MKFDREKPPSTEPGRENVLDHAVRGVPWTMLAYGANKVLGVATTLVLARLLVPEDFGLMALAVVVVSVMTFLSGMGFGGVLISRQHFDRRELGTALTLLVAVSALLALGMAALAPLIAIVFGEPRLTNVVAVLAIVVALNGFNWFYGTMLVRELAFRKRFIAIGIRGIVATAVAIPLAAAGAGVWALVVSEIVASVAHGFVLLAISSVRVLPAFDRRAARELVKSGSPFFLQGGTAFVQQNVDYAAVGTGLGTTQLGYYSMAFRIGELTHHAIADPISTVTFPAFARLKELGTDVGKPFLSTLRLVALVSVPLGLVLSATAGPFVSVALGGEWRSAVGPLALFGLWAAVRPLEVTTGWLLNSVGEAGVVGRLSLIVLPPHVILVVVAAWKGDTTAVAAVMVAMVAITWCLVAGLVDRRTGVKLGDQWLAIQPIVIAGALAWIAARTVVALTHDAAAFWSLSVAVAAGVVTYGLSILVLDPPLPAYAFRQFARALGRRREGYARSS
jgi:lipopolysaccharide exporter